MKIIFFIIAFLNISFSFSQTEKKLVKNSLMDFKTAYNNSDYDAIFNLFSDKMKQEFPLGKTKKIYEKINNAKGNIRELSFEKLIGTSHVYKAKFNRDVLDLVVNIDQDTLINKLVIKRPERNYNKN